MSDLVADCPRCHAKKITFDLLNTIPAGVSYGWKNWVEAFCKCRKCSQATIFKLSQKEISHRELIVKKSIASLGIAVNQVMNVEGYVSLKDSAPEQPPDCLPSNVEAAFREGAVCMAIGCFNAAGTMFRLSVDLSTRTMLPEGETDGLNRAVRRSLGLRLPWLFDNKLLPEALRELSACIKDDGNDGAHEGTLSKEDSEDIRDFTFVLLERIYTEPKRIEIANERRKARREKNSI